MNEWMKQKVALQMSLGTSNEGPRWRIEVTDELSGLRLLEIRLTPDEFGRAVGAHYLPGVDAVVPVPDLYAERAGKRHDVKTVVAPVGSAHGAECLQKALEAVQPHLVDGWQVSDLSPYNWHRRGGSSENGTYTVTLVRWADPSTPKPEPERTTLPAPAKAKVKRQKK